MLYYSILRYDDITLLYYCSNAELSARIAYNTAFHLTIYYRDQTESWLQSQKHDQT